MKKLFSFITIISILTFSIFAQSDDELFGSDDDFFTDDGIEVVENVTAKSDLSKGTIFETGSIKIGGNFTTSVETSTVVYEDTDDSFGDNVKDTTLTPTLNAFLTVDARPTEVLRMYTKFGLAYPFVINASSVPTGPGTSKITVSDWFNLKEMFTDFSVADKAFFRFGLHTVTWGTGIFFSPVSDIINASSINPEDTNAQVDGVLNLRTQITFPNSQNCLWLYVIPSTDFGTNSAATYARDTGFAGKGEFLFGGWEFGLGGYYKYQNAPKITLTASGSVKKFSLFAEAIYQYGSDIEWLEDEDKSFADKTNIFKATAGFMYNWKDPSITLIAQYYFNNYEITFDEVMKYMNNQGVVAKLLPEYLTVGHNVAGALSFGKLFGTTDLTATIFAMANFGKDEIPTVFKPMLETFGIASYINSATFTAMLKYAPTSNVQFGLGPYVTFADWSSKPTVAVKLSASLGGGKF